MKKYLFWKVAMFLSATIIVLAPALPSFAASTTSLPMSTGNVAPLVPVSNSSTSSKVSPLTTASGNCGSLQMTTFSNAGVFYSSWSGSSLTGECGNIIAWELYVDVHEGSTTGPIVETIPQWGGPTDVTTISGQTETGGLIKGQKYCSVLTGNVFLQDTMASSYNPWDCAIY